MTTNALIFRSSKVLSSPLEGTPSIPDIDTGVFWELDPATLSTLADGSPIASWIASGPAPTLNRTYNTQFNGWSMPTYSATGGPSGLPAALFNGSQHISNPAGTTAKIEPLSYVVVCKSNTFANTQSRVFTDTNHWIQPTPSGYSVNTTGNPTAVQSSNATTDWISVIVVFDGPNSIIKVGSGNQIKGTALVKQASSRNLFGSNPTTLTTVGLSGGVAFARAYERALNPSDIDALALSMKRRFGLTT